MKDMTTFLFPTSSTSFTFNTISIIHLEPTLGIELLDKL